MQLFFLVAAEAFTELACEGKEVPSLARESRTARGNNLNDASLQVITLMDINEVCERMHRLGRGP
jgi:hypothetical protein